MSFQVKIFKFSRRKNCQNFDFKGQHFPVFKKKCQNVGEKVKIYQNDDKNCQNIGNKGHNFGFQGRKWSDIDFFFGFQVKQNSCPAY